MDGQQFDNLVKRLHTTRLTRVSVLRGLAAGALAGVFGTKAGGEHVVQAQGGQCRDEGQICEGGGQACCPGTVCNGLENPTRCRVCGGSGQLCCAGGACNTVGEVCLPSGTCGPQPTTPCGNAGEACCPPNNACVSPLICEGGTCQPGAACGAQGQACCAGNLCATSLSCTNGTCQPISTGGGGSVPPPPPAAAFRCTTNAECSARNGAVAPFCNVNTGVCVALQGLNCKSGETPQKCCNRSVRKGCKGKQQSSKHRHNCLRRGKKRCKRLLAGIAV